MTARSLSPRLIPFWTSDPHIQLSRNIFMTSVTWKHSWEHTPCIKIWAKSPCAQQPLLSSSHLLDPVSNNNPITAWASSPLGSHHDPKNKNWEASMGKLISKVPAINAFPPHTSMPFSYWAIGPIPPSPYTCSSLDDWFFQSNAVIVLLWNFWG